MPQSSLLLENLTNGVIAVGTPIVIDTEKARARSAPIRVLVG